MRHVNEMLRYLLLLYFLPVLNLQMGSNQSCSLIRREEQQIRFSFAITGYVNLLTQVLEDLQLSLTSTQPHKYHTIYTESSFQQQMGLFHVFPLFSYAYDVAEPAFVLCFVVLVKLNTTN